MIALEEVDTGLTPLRMTWHSYLPILMALWYLMQICNAEVMMEERKERTLHAVTCLVTHTQVSENVT